MSPVRPHGPARRGDDRRAGSQGDGRHGDGQQEERRQRTSQPVASGPPDRADGAVLVTLVGDEPLAPLLLARQIRARRVICLTQPVVEWRVEPLLELLRRDGRSADAHTLNVVDVPAGLHGLAACLALGPTDEVVFDLTNARGVLGFALYELAHQRELATPDRCRLVRVDWSDRVIRSISPDRATTEPLHATLSLAEYLGVHGKILLGYERGRGSPSPFGPAAHRLARSIHQARPLIEATHRGAADRPLRLPKRQANSHLVDELVEDGVLEWRGSALFATGLQAFQFLHGRWLEEYLFEIADASGRFDDCASGVRYRWSFDGEDRGPGPDEVANEIDFAGTVQGRATIASCKTGGHDVNGPLYELLTLAERAAGRSVLTVFATIDALDRAAGQRAAALGVRVLDASRLADPDLVLATLANGAVTEAPHRVRYTGGRSTTSGSREAPRA